MTQHVSHRHSDEIHELRAEIERLRALLQALHDWYVAYARINNLFNSDGTPATFHELLQARAALEQKPPHHMNDN